MQNALPGLILSFIPIIQLYSGPVRTASAQMILAHPRENGGVAEIRSDSVEYSVRSGVQTETANNVIPAAVASDPFRLSGYTQFRLQEFQSGAGKVGGADLRRIRVSLTGEPARKWQYSLQVDFAYSPKALDAYAKYSARPFLKITAGQFKIPFSQENLVSSSKLVLIDRSQVVEALVARGSDVIGNQNGRDIGLQISGSTLKSGTVYFVDYAVGAFDGNGINTADKNSAKDFCGRLLFHPLVGLDIGGAYYNGFDVWGGAEGSRPRTRYGLELQYSLGPLNIMSEYISGRDAAVKRGGWYVQVGWFVFPKLLQAAGRVDNYDPDATVSGDALTNYSVGMNYCFNEVIRLQTNYVFRREQTIQKANDVFQLQLQFGF